MGASALRTEELEKLAIQAKFQPAQIAAMYRISPRQLQRDFKDTFNKTPTEWLRELRCRLVVELLNRGYSGKVVAADLHYASPAHLCHDFKMVHPVSPRKLAGQTIHLHSVVHEQKCR